MYTAARYGSEFGYSHCRRLDPYGELYGSDLVSVFRLAADPVGQFNAFKGQGNSLYRIRRFGCFEQLRAHANLSRNKEILLLITSYLSHRFLGHTG